jgi:hypothetical protein
MRKSESEGDAQACAATAKGFVMCGPSHTKRSPEQSRGFSGAYSSLCLKLFCPGNLGASGDGGKSPEGPLQRTCPTRQGPSVTAITFWSISSSRDGSGLAVVSPRPSLFGALLEGAQFGRTGKGKT